MNKPNEPSLSFEEALAELEKIVSDLEEKQVSLETSISRYEQGVNLICQCQQLLQEAELKIMKISGVDEAGNPVLEPFEHEATLSKARKPRDEVRPPQK
ncbi:MAG: exodeoxyribonuclease VII small subunit [Gemmataceae bacterium]